MDFSAPDDFRKRAPNWTEDELNALVLAMEQRKSVIDNKDSSAFFSKQRRDAWSFITREVNNAGKVDRSIQQVKEKWQNYSSTAKGKTAKVASSRRLTNLLSNVAIAGFSAGLDTSNISILNSQGFIVDESDGNLFSHENDHDSPDSDPMLGFQHTTPAEFDRSLFEDDEALALSPGKEEVRAPMFTAQMPTPVASIAQSKPIETSTTESVGKRSRKRDSRQTLVDYARVEHEQRLEFMKTEHESRMRVIALKEKLLQTKLELAQEKLKMAIGDEAANADV